MATLALLLTSVQVAVADTVTSTSPDFQVVSGTKSLTVNVGQTKPVTLSYAATKGNGDDIEGCNFKKQGDSLVLAVHQAAVAPASAATLDIASSTTFTKCGDVLTLNVKALQPGTSRITLAYTSGPVGTTATNYDLSGATFVVTVPAVDATPPSITYQLSPAPNGDGWNNSDVSVDWTVTDADSAISSSSGCTDTTITANTAAAGQSLTCSATSAGGFNSATAIVKLDETAPTVTPVVTGTTANNWYTGDVGIAWTVSDGGNSGVKAQGAGCSGASLTADTASQTYHCTVTDTAGNTTSASVEVRRDATKPVITKVVSGTVGNDDWYRSDVSVDWTVSDVTSGPSADTDCADGSLTTDDDGTTYSCHAVDNAGNFQDDAVTVKRDATVPSVTPHVVGTMGANDWYTSDVTLTWTLADNLSGVDAGTATGCEPRSVDADTALAGTVFSCTVQDRAGNSATESVTIKRDATAPTIEHTIVGTSGEHGWYTSNVLVSWTWSDALSDVGTTLNCEPVTQSEETDGTTYTCAVTDLAGNAASDPVTLAVDKTAPTLAPDIDGALGEHGWYVSNTVGVDWTYSDDLSGIGADPVVAGCTPATVSEDTTGDSFTCSVKDRAGNPASASTTILKDSTAPSVAPSFDGTLGEHGWYTSYGDLSWTFEDLTSGTEDGSAVGCSPTTIGHETDGDAFTCSIKDKAGNEGQGDITVKIDKTAPTITPDVQGTTGDNGWYRGDVTVDWDVVDDRSGMADGSTSGCGQSVLDADTAKAEYTCDATDAAGNHASATQEVKRDATAPLISKSVSGVLAADGWNTGDPSVDWTIDEPTSGLSAATDCDDATLSTDSDGTTYHCHAADNAGNEADDSVNFKRDATAPEITVDIQGTEGADGWYTSDVAVDWTVVENGSGIAEETCTDETVTSDTVGTTFSCSVTDVAGNAASENVTIKRDTTAPTADATVTGTLGDHNWYRSNVAVAWTPGDATSGVDESLTNCPGANQTTDTTGTTFICHVTDEAGNTGQGTVTVKRDATAPVVTWTGGPADSATYDFGNPIPSATCSATDATSGVTGDACSVTGGGSGVGQHSLTAAAADNAGNLGIVSRTYVVRAWTIDGFYRPVDMTAGVLNTAKAGSTVPLKFNVVKGATAMTANIGAMFTATRINCDGTAASNAIDEFATTGQTSLRWDATAQQWIQNWATPSAGKGKCYEVDLSTADGTTRFARFQLK